MRVFAPLVLLLGCVLQAKCQLSAPTIKDYEGEYVYVDDGYADDDYQDLSKFLDEEMEKTGTSSRSTTISIIYSVIVLSGFLLNILGLVISQRCTAIQYSQKLFMQNLCISCLLLLISLVFSAHYRAYNDWILGGIMCKVLNCLKSLSMFCQCFFTVAVTADYVVMRKRPRIGSIRRTVMEILTVAVGWILALGFSIPMLIFAKTDRLGSERQMCTLFPGYDTRFQPLDSQFDDENTGEWFS
uniref:G-protein coupled receptors family 1 profile domain-containing protein n=1 Tax=Ciona savignyi TaxID=51511 RepID=H2YGH0_CIOSA